MPEASAVFKRLLDWIERAESGGGNDTNRNPLKRQVQSGWATSHANQTGVVSSSLPPGPGLPARRAEAGFRDGAG